MSTLRACWLTQRPSGVAVIPATRTDLVASSMEERDVSALEEERVDGGKVALEDARARRQDRRAT